MSEELTVAITRTEFEPHRFQYGGAILGRCRTCGQAEDTDLHRPSRAVQPTVTAHPDVRTDDQPAVAQPVCQRCVELQDKIDRLEDRMKVMVSDLRTALNACAD